MIVFLLTLIWTASARAVSGEELYNHSLYYWQQAQDNVQKIGSQCMDCGAFTAGKPDTERLTCDATWADFYKKRVIDIRVLMGYTDFGKSVYDSRTAQAMIDVITDQCTTNANLCGFKRDPDDDRYFYKPISVNGRRKTVRIQIAWSSVTDNDLANTKGARANEQKKRTEEMEALFKDSLVNADATFYLGHARFGAGPDFAPPRKLANGERDDAYYKNPKNHASRESMLKTLRETPKVNKLFGLFGCDADALFGKDLKNARPDMGLMTPTGLAYPESSTAQLYGALDSILGRRCEKDFVAATNNVRSIELQAAKKVITTPVAPIRLTNFYKQK